MFGTRGPADPLLSSNGWAKVKAHWRTLRLPCQAPRCHLPGVPIDYDGPYLVTIRGKRTINRRAFHCGHIVSRRKARLLRWSAERTNAVGNTRPEHAACSVKAGAREGRAAQTTVRLITSRQW